MRRKALEPKIELPKIKVDEKLLLEIQQQTNPERQVIVHCYFSVYEFFLQVRLWPSTYLYDEHSAHRSNLIQVYGIELAPEWSYHIGFDPIRFTLIFSGLPKDVASFYLSEEAAVKHPFFSRSIERNKSDVYHVHLLV